MPKSHQSAVSTPSADAPAPGSEATTANAGYGIARSGAAGAEAPPTNYGQTKAAEDLSESVMYYFVDPGTLKSKASKRSAWIDGVVKSWTPKPAAPSP